METKTYPQAIADEMLEIHASGQEIEDLRREVQQFEDAAFTEVLTARQEGSDKPLFSNETARMVAVRAHLSRSDDYTAAQLRLRRAENDRAAHVARLEQLRLEYRLRLIDYEVEFLGRRN